MSEQLLGVIGWSGSGKTSLLEFLLKDMVAMGLRVNVLKHSHHDVIIEPPQKDSARLRLAGAAEVMLASPYRYVITKELRNMSEPSLSDLLLRMSEADITLIEGYKWEPVPKMEVYRSSLGKPPIYPEDPYVLAVASDDPRPPDCPANIAWLNLNQPESVLNWLLAAMRNKFFSSNTKVSADT